MSDPRFCEIFCRGKHCPYCSSTHRFKPNECAVPGLYSTWITDDILATARPSTEIIKKKNLINIFKELHIKTIINMQIPGEHPYCGDGINKSGFSYDPEMFMEAGIFHYNFAWRDYEVGSIRNVLDAVKVMMFALEQGRVAVHCHAGLGRTGTLIVCLFIFRDNMTAKQAVRFVRARRPGSVQSTVQLARIKQFAAFVQTLRGIFLERNSIDLPAYLQRQCLQLRGIETKNFQNIPKIVYVCFRLLLRLAYPPSSSREFQEVLPCDPEDPLCDGVIEDYCKDLQSDDESLTDDFISPRLVMPLSKVRQTPVRKKAVLDAFLDPKTSEEVLDVVELWKARLNTNDSLWQRMCKEIRNPATIVKLLYDWFSSLKMPAVREEDVPNLYCSCERKEDNDFFNNVSKPVGTLLKTCSRFVFYLRLRNFQDEAAIIERLVVMVTQEPTCGPSPRVDGPNRQAVWKLKLAHILHHTVQAMGDT